MENRNSENLRELFEKFFDAEQAESCVEDIQKAEQRWMKIKVYLQGTTFIY